MSLPLAQGRLHHPTRVACWPLQAPCRLIATNAGVEGEVIVQKLAGQPFHMGYNAMDDKIQNLLEAGIIDPAKVKSLLGTCCLGVYPTAEHSSTPDISLPPLQPQVKDAMSWGMSFACCSSS